MNDDDSTVITWHLAELVTNDGVDNDGSEVDKRTFASASVDSPIYLGYYDNGLRRPPRTMKTGLTSLGVSLNRLLATASMTKAAK